MFTFVYNVVFRIIHIVVRIVELSVLIDYLSWLEYFCPSGFPLSYYYW